MQLSMLVWRQSPRAFNKCQIAIKRFRSTSILFPPWISNSVCDQPTNYTFDLHASSPFSWPHFIERGTAYEWQSWSLKNKQANRKQQKTQPQVHIRSTKNNTGKRAKRGQWKHRHRPESRDKIHWAGRPQPAAHHSLGGVPDLGAVFLSQSHSFQFGFVLCLHLVPLLQYALWEAERGSM